MTVGPAWVNNHFVTYRLSYWTNSEKLETLQCQKYTLYESRADELSVDGQAYKDYHNSASDWDTGTEGKNS
jgi:hypothetical protein